MHLGFKADATHPNRLPHILPVDHKLLRLHQQKPLISRDIDGSGGLNHPSDIGLRDFAVFDRHHATRIDAPDMAAGNTGVDTLNFAVCHQLRLFQGLLNALDRGIDIDHHAAF